MFLKYDASKFSRPKKGQNIFKHELLTIVEKSSVVICGYLFHRMSSKKKMTKWGI